MFWIVTIQQIKKNNNEFSHHIVVNSYYKYIQKIFVYMCLHGYGKKNYSPLGL